MSRGRGKGKRKRKSSRSSEKSETTKHYKKNSNEQSRKNTAGSVSGDNASINNSEMEYQDDISSLGDNSEKVKRVKIPPIVITSEISKPLEFMKNLRTNVDPDIKFQFTSQGAK